MNRSLTLSLAVAAALTLGACGDGGTGPDDGGNSGGNNTPSRQILADPSFATNIQEIFNRRGCASGSCHGSGTQSAGLNLSSGSSYASLVNVTSTQVAVARVIPGNANDSYLIVKVEGRQTVGNRMPPGASALDNIDLTNLKNWIAQGAKNN
jgi:hypothetical protein